MVKATGATKPREKACTYVSQSYKPLLEEIPGFML